jgi:hypothetical protein
VYEPEELQAPLDVEPSWFILGERNKLLGRLPMGIARDDREAVTQFLRRNPVLAARLSAEEREQIFARRES